MSREPIAIVGLGCRFPGARDTRAFWKLLTGGVDAITRVPPDRWDIKAFYDPNPAVQGKMSTCWGGFLEQVDRFDPQFFKIAPREVASMDPQQRLLLEVAWEAMEDAGQIPERLAGTQTGVFIGMSSYDYGTILCRDPRNVDAYIGTGNTNCIAANRISYLFDLRGPSMALDTACSSSLVAVHLGCKSLWAGESSLVIAGGVQLVLSPLATVGYSMSGFMSPDGRCKAFDASANGYVRSEGAGIVILKPLSRALEDGDPIYAVIRGSAVNQDGRSNGLTAPSPAAQEAVLREAYRQADVAPYAVQYVEAHGSGTKIGDPIEMKSLAAVVGPGRAPGSYCAVGSVKSNIGHLEAAAGIAGLIKTALSLRHRQIPPSLHFKVPNPYIPFDKIPLRVQDKLEPWPEGPGPALAGVSSFGFGGTNAHLVLEEAPAAQPSTGPQVEREMARPQHILTLRAKSESSLRELSRRYQELLVEQPASAIEDVCHSANTGRSSFAHRLTVTAGSTSELAERLGTFAQGQHAPGTAYAVVTGRKRSKVAFLFTGLGAQYVGMGHKLYQTQPTFRATLDRCDEVLRGYLDRPLLSILFSPSELPAGQGSSLEEGNGQVSRPRRTFLKPSPRSLLDETVYGQPALFALEVALAELWRSWGVEPALLLGHSVGELAAACVAGVFSLEDGLRLVAERARLMHALPSGGAMVAVFATEARVAAAIEEHGQALSIAAVNGPENIVLSGQSEALRAVVAALEAGGVKTQSLRVSQAFHSALVEPMLDPLEQVVRSIRVHAPRIPLISNVTGAVLSASEIPDAAYWRRHTRAPVRFQAGIQALHAQRCEVMLEIGPTPVLTYLGVECLPEAQVRWLPSLVERQDEWNVMLGSLSALFLGGLEIDWKNFDKGYQRRRLSLPNYPFERKRYWFEEGAQSEGESLPAAPTMPAVARESLLAAPTVPAVEREPLLRAPAVEREPLPAVEREPLPPASAPMLPISERSAGGIVPSSQMSVVSSSARRDAIEATVRLMIADALKVEPSEVASHVRFLDMGADSFTLVEVVQLLEAKYEQTISIRQLFEELTTVDALVDHIERHLPPEPAVPPQLVPRSSAPSEAAPPRAISERSERNAPPPPVSLGANPLRRGVILTALRAMAAGMLRAAPSEVGTDVTFLDMGADSTTLIEIIRLISAEYDQRITIRQLFEELSTLDALADHIERHLPPEAAAPPQVAPPQVAPPQVAPLHAAPAQVFPQNAAVQGNGSGTKRRPAPPPQAAATSSEPAAKAAAAPVATMGGGALERLFSQQLEIVSKQLDVLREWGPQAVMLTGAANESGQTPALEAPASPASLPAIVMPELRREAAPVVPPAPQATRPALPVSAPDTANKGEMSLQQQRHLQALIERFTQRTKQSKALTQAHRSALSDSRGVAGFRMPIKEITYPIIGSRYRGSRIWDVDDNEYVDIAMGFGVHLFGHDAPFIQRAITEQMARGFGIGPQPEHAGELAELFVEMTGADRVTFCQSGTEAVMTALRLARTATRRQKIVLFKGSFHGHFDGVLAQGRGSDSDQASLAAAPGVSAGAVRDVVVLDYGEPSALEYIRRHAHDLAAILVEPVQSRRPDLQPRAFLHELRAITEAAGTALIFDEIITGFRIHPGGAQAYFGVRADLATYGKILGGGLPLAAVAGKRRFMDGIDGGMWSYGDLSYPENERTFFAGTFNKPPLSLRAALAVLRHLKEQGPRLQEALNERTARLAATVNDYFEKEEIPARVVHFGSLFRFVLKGNLELFYSHLLDRGVYVWEGRSCFLSTAHTEADVAYVIDAIRASMDELRGGGFLPQPPPDRPRPQQGVEPARLASQPLEPLSVAPVAASAKTAVGAANGSVSNDLTALDQPREGVQQPMEFWERRRIRTPPAERAADQGATRGAVRHRRAREDLEFSLYYFGKYEAAFRDDKYDLLFESARFADEHGFTAIWVPERHFHPFGGFSPNPSVLCAALARETKHIQLRAGSVVVPLHHPVRIAEEWAMVDNLSKGRVGLSFASGWHPDDFVFAPDAYGKHRELMFQGIETIRKLWRGETIRAAAGNKSHIDVSCFPLPMQGELPVWITIVNNADTYVRAGEIGASVLTNLMSQTLEALAKNIGLYRDALERSGHDPASGHVTVLLHTFVGDDLDATRAMARKPFCDYLDSHISLFQNVAKSQNLTVDLDKLTANDRQYMLSMAYERYARTSALIGTPESCAEIIDQLRDIGVDEVACFVDFGIDVRSVLGGMPSLRALKERYRRGGGSGAKAESSHPGATAAEGSESQGSQATPAATARLLSPALLPPVAGSEGGTGELEDAEIFPMTLAQWEALTLVTLASTDTAIGASVCLELRGPLRLNALRRALQQVIDRHEALRTTLTPERDAMRIAKRGSVPVGITDLSSSQGDELERAATEWLRTEGRRGFDLVQGPVFRASLATMSEQRHLLLLSTHHVLCDGWSIGIIVDELSELYTAECQGKTCLLPLPLQFREYVARKEALRGTEEMARHERYWLEKLAGEIHQLDLPTDRPRPAVKTYRARRLTHRLDAGLCQDLHRVAREHGCTFFMFQLASYLLLLHRMSGQDELIIGIPVAGQVGERDRSLVGNCANLLPILSSLVGCERFSDLLLRTKTVLLEAFEHRDYSFHALVTRLPLPRDPSRTPLVSVVFNMDRAPSKMMGLETGYWHSQPIDFALSDTSLNIIEVSDELVLDWNYNEDLFDEETVERWRIHYEALLRSIVGSAKQRLAQISTLPAAERRQVLAAWNDTRADFPSGACLHELFEQQATRTPEALAVSCGSQTLSFGELSRRSSQLAHHLRSLGVDRGTGVALYLERSVEMVVSLLAILKAGGAYVPLDPSNPAERIASVLVNAHVPLFVTSSGLAAGLTLPAPVHPLYLDQLEPTLSALPATPPAGRATPDDAAYILYTSGSTGAPRGVVVQHRSVVNLLGALQTAVYARYDGRPMRVSVNGSMAFDTSVKQIIQLLHGHAIDIIPAPIRLDGAALLDYIRERSIDVLDCTPSQLQLLLAAHLLERPGKLRCVLVGGEAIDDSMWQELGRSSIDFFNVYGPTECTVDATACRIEPIHARPVLGKPLSNMRVYVLDRDLQPAPIGVPGELFISGAGVARGYLDDPALTAERFLPDPFHDEPGTRMYRTGDKARWLSSGYVEFLGRLDYQVKVRGFRIELSEVEAALSRLPAIQTSVVIVREDVPGDKRLVAYFVSRETQPVPTPQQLHRALRGSLPEYMVPSAFMALEALPLTPNGKVDRQALPELDPAVLGAAEAYVAPRTPTEDLLAGLWSNVLRAAHAGESQGDIAGARPISVTANFFHLGGNSLLAVRVLGEIERRTGQKLRVHDLFEDPTIEHLAEVLHRSTTWAGRITHQEPQMKDQGRKLLVRIRTRGERTPLFFAPMLGGVYHSTVDAGILNLAKYLDSEQPFYGLQAPALALEMADSDPFPSLDGWHYESSRFDHIVDNCIARMEEVRPGGPYFLGGFCTGSLLALEIARRAKGVERLILIDPRVDSPPARQWDGGLALIDDLDPQLAALSCFMARQVGVQAGWDPALLYEELKAVPPEQRWDEARDRLVAAGCLPASTTSGLVRRVFQGKEFNGRVLDQVMRTYKPGQYSGPVTMLFCEQITRGAMDAVISEAMPHIRKYLLGRLDVHFVKGDHDSLFQEPNIGVLMEHINHYLAMDSRA